MSSRYMLYVGLAIACCIVGSLAHAQDHAVVPKNGIENVIKLSNNYARQEGLDLRSYFISKVEYDASKKQWMVFFMGNIPLPGHHFVIMLDDNTEKMNLMRGQ